MEDTQIKSWQHSHVFGQDQKRLGEVRTMTVIVITATMMIVEIVTGVIFGSISLLADGLHMASHAAALTINVFAYIYARRQANNKSYSFGTGKVNALGGFTGAILLAIFAIIMAWESVERLINPVQIAFNQAIFVAIMGLIVNGVSVFILWEQHSHADEHLDNVHSHEHQHDHNLRAAYLHVLADALTSILAILALFAGKYVGLFWMDPLMGIVGAILVSRWSLGLIRTTSGILLDKQAPKAVQNQIKKTLEKDGGTLVTDIHLWAIGPNIYSLIISILAKTPQWPEDYKNQLPSGLGLAHIVIEVNHASDFETIED